MTSNLPIKTALALTLARRDGRTGRLGTGSRSADPHAYSRFRRGVPSPGVPDLDQHALVHVSAHRRFDWAAHPSAPPAGSRYRQSASEACSWSPGSHYPSQSEPLTS